MKKKNNAELINHWNVVAHSCLNAAFAKISGKTKAFTCADHVFPISLLSEHRCLHGGL